MAGPLSGFRIIELVGIGPGPFAGMMLADMGAEVIAVDKSGARINPLLAKDFNRRGKKSVTLDLKSADGKAALLALVKSADALFEGFRPGVLESLGLGPDVLLAANPKLVVGRITGWGQDGPLAKTAGHDINYLAITGMLHAMGPADRAPTPPLNLVADYGGGAMMLLAGMLAALLEAQKTGRGQVVDAAMVDGVGALMSLYWSFLASGTWDGARDSNFLSGNAHFYGCYETADGGFMAVGTIEPQFAVAFYTILGLDPALVAEHMNRPNWPAMRQRIAERFKTKTQAEWASAFDGSDACVTPVLSVKDAPEHPHNKARSAFETNADGVQPAPAPRFSGHVRQGVAALPDRLGGDTQSVLDGLDLAPEVRARLREN